jgi:hypothetical protein
MDVLPSTKVMLIGDTHGDAAFLDACLARAPELGITTAVQLGDFGIAPGDSGQRFLDSASQSARTANVALYAYTGNHDDQTQIAQFESNPDPDGFVTLRPNLRWIPRSHRWTWHGRRLAALGGAFSIDWQMRTPGIDWWPDAEEVRNSDVERLGYEPLDVLFTHDAPDHAQPITAFEVMPADEIQARLSRYWLRIATENTTPELVIHGHWHTRNRTTLQLRTHDLAVRVEGFAANSNPELGSWGVLDLCNLSVTVPNSLKPHGV